MFRSRRIAIALLLFACAKKSSLDTPCKVTSDCQSGLFCVSSVCKSNIGSGAACTSASDCKPQEACADGKCGQLGCDGAHPCNNGCCNAGQCVASNACSGGFKCGSDGACPARCDAANKGNGCNSGCCDANGDCVDGTATNACGSGSSCVNCGSGGTCANQTCVCDDTTCSGADQVCAGSICAECSSNPCGGNTPICDPSTHMCQPCTQTTPPQCSSATPYCDELAGASAGSCSAAPDSSAACAARDPFNPILLTSGACGCNDSSDCPNGLACNGSNTCETTCVPNTSDSCGDPNTYCGTDNSCTAPLIADGITCDADGQCQSQHCDCTAADCSLRACGVVCAGPCAYSNDSGATCDGSLKVQINKQTPQCTDTNACDGKNSVLADCLHAAGQPCDSVPQTLDATCASGHCVYSEVTGTAQKICGIVACRTCEYSVDQGQSCAEIGGNQSTPDCGAGSFCVGGECRLPNGANCHDASGFCQSQHCNCNTPDCTADTWVCTAFDCGGCAYNSNPDDTTSGSCDGPVGKNVECGGDTDETDFCDGTRTACQYVGTCLANCNGGGVAGLHVTNDCSQGTPSADGTFCAVGAPYALICFCQF